MQETVLSVNRGDEVLLVSGDAEATSVKHVAMSNSEGGETMFVDIREHLTFERRGEE